MFICGGAFDGLDKIIKARTNKKVMGFNAEGVSRMDQQVIDATIYRELVPQDLLKYGLIPEFVGRLPVQVALDMLDEEALVRILRDPKNSLLKQYQTLFGMDEVELVMEDEALHAIARKANERKTGARGLKSIMEDVLHDLMYEIPSMNDLVKVTITEDVVNKLADPIFEYGEAREAVWLSVLSQASFSMPSCPARTMNSAPISKEIRP